MDISRPGQGTVDRLQMMNTNGREHIILYGVNPALFRLRLLGLLDKPVILLDWEIDDYGCNWMAGYGIQTELKLSVHDKNMLDKTDKWLDEHPDWRMGYFNYDLKNIIEPQLTLFKEEAEEAGIHLIVPEVVFMERSGEVHAYICKGSVLPEWEKWKALESNGQLADIPFEPEISQAEYVERISLLKNHIKQGDIYEINFCTQWKSDFTIQYPGAVYQHLWSALQAPFSAYARLEELSLICNSPERYLARRGNTLISQPIKGTSPRDADENIDFKNRLKLEAEKERSENVMIVDLVRNDLAKVAVKGSVKVDELFGIYSYNQVHQLISTVSCQMEEGKKFSDILKATFPMGSMTGAPKISAMQLSEKYEPMKRGLYSGTIGYFDPSGNFDFNVIIRSLISNQNQGNTVARTGSAITWDADPEMEWAECVLKIKKLIS
jgi:para-aminobenzoate synthetase component 1